jgi:hypothetical protein
MPGPWCFAWCGGLIDEQQTVVTTGSTHGGQIEKVSIVGDIDSGSQSMLLADTGKLDDDGLYLIEGPGVDAATLYDSTIAAANSLNLLSAATADASSATYTATKAQLLGFALVSFVEDSDTITISDVPDTLVPDGTYSISAHPIGDAGDAPVTAAYLSWDGSVGTMSAVVALDTGGVEVRAVTATATGDYYAEINGFATSDWYSVTGIPLSALASLTAGAVYNISGNGIVAGTTFIAPASGATEITLDTATSAAVATSLLTITGPRTPDEPWNPAVHGRFDEDVVSVEITQTEGDFATLTIELRNPGIGLLAAGRNLWCWLSYDRNWPIGPPDLSPLFNGRLIGVPKRATGEIVELQFLARPDDFIAQKAALADDLKVLPYYDPVWFDSTVTPDTVLEGYSALWHIDRTTLELTASDIIRGEDGTITIGEDLALYDNFEMSYGSPPLASVAVSGSVSWDQQAAGVLDISQSVLNAFKEQSGTAYGRTLANTSYLNSIYTPYKYSSGSISGGGIVQVLSGGGLLNAWPKGGTNIGAGWAFATGVDHKGKSLCFCEEATTNPDTDTTGFDETFYNVKYSTTWLGVREENTDYSGEVNTITLKQGMKTVTISFPVTALRFRTVVEYKASRRRTETVQAVMVADVQRQLSDSADQDQEELTLTSDVIDQGVDIGGDVPLGSSSYASYFQTERGARSLEYLLLAARAKLRARARSVEVTFAVPWTLAIQISLRHSVTLQDRRLPGGTCTGKVKSYTLTAKDGVQIGEFVLGCTIGNGTPSVAAAGVPVYADDGYVEDGWQVRVGAQYPLLADEFAYETLDSTLIDDDGVNLSNISHENAVRSCTVVNGMLDQVEALSKYQNQSDPVDGDPRTEMSEMETTVTLELVPLTGSEFHTDFFPALTQLSLPKTIDLAAEG